MRALLYILATIGLWYAGGVFGVQPFLVAGVALAITGLFSYILALWSRAHLRVRMAPPATAVQRGETARFALTIENRSLLPVGVARVHLLCHYRDGQTAPLTLVVQATCQARCAMGAWIEMDAPHCGVLKVEASKLELCDLLGLWTVRSFPRLESAQVAVVPRAEHPAHALAPIAQRACESSPLPQSPHDNETPPDIHDLRDYAPGDPLHAVHWKVSARRETLVTRVYRDDTFDAATLFVDTSYPHEQALETADAHDAVLETAANIVQGLVMSGVSCTVTWRDGESLERRAVCSADEASQLGRDLALAMPSERAVDDDAVQAEGGAAVFTLHANGELCLGGSPLARATENGQLEGVSHGRT